MISRIDKEKIRKLSWTINECSKRATSLFPHAFSIESMMYWASHQALALVAEGECKGMRAGGSEPACDQSRRNRVESGSSSIFVGMADRSHSASSPSLELSRKRRSVFPCA